MSGAYEFAALTAAFTVAAAVLDYRTRKIPNWLTVPAAVLGLLYSSFAPNGVGVLFSLAGFAVGFSLLILPWLLGGGGMGDVKLLAALGAWTGPLTILAIFAVAVFFACVLAVGVMASTVMTQGFSTARGRYMNSGAGAGGGSAAVMSGDSPKRIKRVLPFGIPVAIATVMVVAWLVLKPTV